MTSERMRALIREMLEWCEVFHEAMPRGTQIRECLYNSTQISVMLLQEGGTTKKGTAVVALPARRYIHMVSSEHVTVRPMFDELLVSETALWNALTPTQKHEAAKKHLGSSYQREKIEKRLLAKNFSVGPRGLSLPPDDQISPVVADGRVVADLTVGMATPSSSDVG